MVKFAYVGYLKAGEYEDIETIPVKVFYNVDVAASWANFTALVINANHNFAKHLYKAEEHVRNSDRELFELKKSFWDYEQNGWKHGSNDPRDVEGNKQYIALTEKKAKELQENARAAIRRVLEDCVVLHEKEDEGDPGYNEHSININGYLVQQVYAADYTKVEIARPS